MDVFPPEIELFAHARKDRMWNKRSKNQESNGGHAKIGWEWGFVLLLEDAEIPTNTVSEKLRVVVGNDVGQGLLSQNAMEYVKATLSRIHANKDVVSRTIQE